MATTLRFDIFARSSQASKEFDKLSRKVRDTHKDISRFGDNAARSFAKTASSLSNISTAATGLQGVASIVSSLSGVLGLLPAAAASAAAAFATLAVGVQGFGEGFKQLADSSKISRGVSGAADTAVQSARRIEDAQRNLTRTLRGTKDAEQALARAQRDATDAQNELNRAREEAAEQLEDLNRSVAGAALDEESAVLAVARAHEQLAEATRSGASGLDLAEAQLGIRQAEQALEETRDRYRDLQKEAAKANAAGVEGSDQVINAQRGVEDAALGVQHAQQGVADAAEAVADAQRDLAEAHEDAARAADKAGGAVGALTDKFDKLSNNTKDTIRAILSLGGAWTDLQHSVADALFAGVADEVKRLGGAYIPVLKQGLTGIAEEFNKAARSTSQFLVEGKQVDSIRTILSGSKEVTGQFAAALRPLVSILLDVATVGSEMLPGLTGGFGKAAESAAAFVRNARETGALREWIQQGLDTLKKLGELFGNIGSIIGSIFSGLNAGGKSFLDTMISVTGKVEAFLQTAEAQQALKSLGQALAAVSSVVTEVFLTGLKELAPVIVELAPGFAEFARIVGDLLVSAIRIVGPLLKGLAGFISDNIDWLGPLAIALYGAVKAFEAVGVALKVLAAIAAVNPWVLLIAAVVALAILIITHWEDIKKALAAAWDWIKRTAGQVWEGIKNVIVDPIVTAAKWIGEKVGNIVDFFASLPRRIGDALGSLGRVIGDIFKGALNIAIRVINGFISVANTVIDGLNFINPFSDIPHIPKIRELHSGGVVPGLPGQEKVAILEAGERVFPADYDWGPPPSMRGGMRAVSGGGGAQDVRVMLVPAPGAVGAVADLINELVRTKKITAVKAA